jgi:hypothetical protein
MPPRQRFTYFVSFHSGTANGQAGFGNTEMVLPAPILRLEQVREIEGWLRQHLGIPHIVVLNYQLLMPGPIP